MDNFGIVAFWVSFYSSVLSVVEDSDKVFCKVCKILIVCKKKSHISQHLETNKHKLNASLILQENNKSEFIEDLCESFICANIPFHKLNIKFRGFLEKYCRRAIPDESTLRKNYLGNIFHDILLQIKNSFSGKEVWVSIDETQDSLRRSIANVIIGSLNSNSIENSFSVSCRQLERTNFSIISALVC